MHINRAQIVAIEVNEKLPFKYILYLPEYKNIFGKVKRRAGFYISFAHGYLDGKFLTKDEILKGFFWNGIDIPGLVIDDDNCVYFPPNLKIRMSDETDFNEYFETMSSLKVRLDYLTIGLPFIQIKILDSNG